MANEIPIEKFTDNVFTVIDFRLFRLISVFSITEKKLIIYFNELFLHLLVSFIISFSDLFASIIDLKKIYHQIIH